MIGYQLQIDDKSAFMSEKERKEYYQNTMSYQFDIFNTYAIQSFTNYPSILSEMYQNHLFRKSLLFNYSNSIKKIILQSKDGSLVKNYGDYLNKKNSECMSTVSFC